ncbi:MAG TPA: COX15/CtaA family protein [Mycobacteriales bacterium]|jgi:Uncharacterized protein required for cytochrome oxidase assembly
MLTRPSAATVRWLTAASVVANSGIVVTGGAVRLTGSGLGCPTVPRCTDESYIPTPALGVHGLIEFGNRMVTFMLTAVVVATLVAVVRQRPRRRPLVILSVAVLLGIPAQAVLGAITVLTGLNPWTVAGHFVVSMALIALSVLLWHRARQGVDTPSRPTVGPPWVLLVRALVALTAVTLVLGTMVTASGPHAGDQRAVRTGFDLIVVSQLHADAVMLLVGLSVATWVTLRATGAGEQISRAAATLVAVELVQGAIGYTQYFTGLPVPLVEAHVFGSCLVWVAAVRLLLLTRVRTVPGSTTTGSHPAGVDVDTDPVGSAAKVSVPAR